MATYNFIHVVLDEKSEMVGGTFDVKIAMSYVQAHPGHTWKRIPRLRECSAATHQGKNEITPELIQSAIQAKLTGISLSSFAKTRNVRYEHLRDAVNSEWGFTKPWPKP